MIITKQEIDNAASMFFDKQNAPEYHKRCKGEIERLLENQYEMMQIKINDLENRLRFKEIEVERIISDIENLPF